MTPQKAEDLFARVGNMAPSKSSLDRLPKALGERWEAERETYEQVLREAIVVPDEARSIAVSIDGVLAPVDGGASPTEVRATAADEGRTSKGPAGYREMGCATLAFCDDKGDLISGDSVRPRARVQEARAQRDAAQGSRARAREASGAETRQDHRRGQRQLGVHRDAARGAGDPGLLPCDRAPCRGARGGPRRRHDRDAAQVRRPARAPADGGPRRRGGDRALAYLQRHAPAVRKVANVLALLPEEQASNALRASGSAKVS